MTQLASILNDVPEHLRTAEALQVLKAYLTEALGYILYSFDGVGARYARKLESTLNVLGKQLPPDVREVLELANSADLTWDKSELQKQSAGWAQVARHALEFSAGRHIVAMDLEAVAAVVEAVAGKHLDAFYSLQLNRARGVMAGTEQGHAAEMVAEV